jgi:hypothetical protein
MRDKSDSDETPGSGWPETDKRVAAIGKASEALEYIERARGHLYSFHQLMGRGDIEFGVACDLLESAGIADDAARLRREIVGRNALDGRWSFQIVDEFDDLYYEPARYEVRRLEQQHLNGHRHAYEAGLKEQRRTFGHPAHTSRPPHSK